MSDLSKLRYPKSFRVQAKRALDCSTFLTVWVVSQTSQTQNVWSTTAYIFIWSDLRSYQVAKQSSALESECTMFCVRFWFINECSLYLYFRWRRARDDKQRLQTRRKRSKSWNRNANNERQCNIHRVDFIKKISFIHNHNHDTYYIVCGLIVKLVLSDLTSCRLSRDEVD